MRQREKTEGIGRGKEICTVSERQITERRMTERRIIERQITERRITKRRKLPNVEYYRT